jgi:GcrA cell cycle regulator
MPSTPPTISPASSQTSSQTWTDERIALLKSHFDAGLSCREIAADIGVSRNAVIGKLSRLNLTRGPKREERRNDGQRNGGARIVKAVPRLQYEMLATIYGEADARLAYEPIDDANRCSLLDLTENRCRWPISTPGADDFCFCGNASPDGQPYCQGHSRLAYRPNSRARVVSV